MRGKAVCGLILTVVCLLVRLPREGAGQPGREAERHEGRPPSCGEAPTDGRTEGG